MHGHIFEAGLFGMTRTGVLGVGDSLGNHHGGGDPNFDRSGANPQLDLAIDDPDSHRNLGHGRVLVASAIGGKNLHLSAEDRANVCNWWQRGTRAARPSEYSMLAIVRERPEAGAAICERSRRMVRDGSVWIRRNWR